MNDALASRIERLESTLAIQHMPVRYALALDSRVLGAWVQLFVADVSSFYRSVHPICGHAINLVDADNATGTVYCRTDHEDNGRWVVMAIVCFDAYVRRDGAWYILQRNEEYFFAANVLERPDPVDFMKWEAWKNRSPTLPSRFPSWKPFWDSVDPQIVENITQSPV